LHLRCIIYKGKPYKKEEYRLVKQKVKIMLLGLDFGTCYSSAALGIANNPKLIKEPINRGYSFPSSIFINNQEQILIGQAAENFRQKDPQRYRREFKRDLGSPNPYTIGNVVRLPEELVTEMLRKLKTEAEKMSRGLGEDIIASAVLTIPATYQPYKRQLMEQAGLKAGFNQIKLLEEPVAAAMYYSRQATVQEQEIVLVYDLGGGTFDATLIQKQKSGYQIIGIPRGLAHCGGTDFDRQIYQELRNRCSQELRQQLEARDAWLARAIVTESCRDLKHQLSEQQDATIYIPMGLTSVESFSLSQGEFNQMIAPLITETIECCDQLVRSAGINWQQINRILLVGGSCRIPFIKETIEQKVKCPALLVDEPELAVCLGAAIDSTDSKTTAPTVLLSSIRTEVKSHDLKPPVNSVDTPVVQSGKQNSSVAGSQQRQASQPISAPTPSPVKPETATPTQTAKNFYQIALAKNKAQDYSSAMDNLDRALQLQTDYPEAYSMRGEIRQQLGDRQGGTEDLQQAAKLFFNQKDYLQYQKVLQKIQEVPATRTTVQNPEPLRRDRPQESTPVTPQPSPPTDKPSTSENPATGNQSQTRTYISDALVCFAAKNYLQAIEQTTKAIHIDSKCLSAYVARGFSRFMNQDYRGALQDFNHTIYQDCGIAAAYFGRSILKAYLGDHPLAIKDCQRLQQLDNQFNRVEHNKMMAAATQKDSTQIAEYFQSNIKRLFENSNNNTVSSQQKFTRGQSSNSVNYLSQKKQLFINRSFSWNERVDSSNFSFQAVAQGKYMIMGFSRDSYFVFANFDNLDLPTFRHFARESFSHCKNSRSGIKLQGIICYPVAVVEEASSNIISSIALEPPTSEDIVSRPSFIFPVVYDLKNRQVYCSQQKPLFNWAGWSKIQNTAQEMLK
jgi:molecular chaperone DnaK (HSP70)